jgi:hypothetical protein
LSDRRRIPSSPGVQDASFQAFVPSISPPSPHTGNRLRCRYHRSAGPYRRPGTLGHHLRWSPAHHRATIKVYAVGNTGNGSPATDILTGPLGSAPNAYATTDNSGAFQINGAYSCPANAATPIYIVATGGNPGITPAVSNTAIALVAALGPCNAINTANHIILNEATTAAAAWALAPFANSVTNIGATSTNLTGITNAFIFANELAETTTGYSPGLALPTGAATESAKLYSLANVLASCINSTGTTKACSGLFTDVTPTGGTKPTDTFATALSVVQNPGNNVANIFNNHVNAVNPFVGLASAPNDWTMTIRYASQGEFLPSAGPLANFTMGAIDSSGNLVGIGTSGNNVTLASFNRQFTQLLNVPVCPDGNGYCYGTLTIDDGFAIDSAGDLWVDTVYVENNPDPTAGTNVGPFSVSEFSSAGAVLSPISGEPVGSVASGGNAQAQAIAADSNGTVWVGNFGDSGGNVALLNSGGTLLSPSAGYGNLSGISPINIALDSDHTAWVASWGYANEAGKSVSYPYITSIANAGTNTTSAASPTITEYNITSPVTYAIAVDPSNNVWFTSGQSESAGFNNLGYIKSTGTVGATAIQTGGMVNGISMATDPGNHVWIANSGPTSLILTLSEFSTAVGTIGTALSPSTGYGLDAGLATAYPIENIPGLIIDSTGSLWLPNTYVDQPGQEYFNTNYPVITVFVGLATPTQTPLLGPPQTP